MMQSDDYGYHDLKWESTSLIELEIETALADGPDVARSDLGLEQRLKERQLERRRVMDENLALFSSVVSADFMQARGFDSLFAGDMNVASLAVLSAGMPFRENEKVAELKKFDPLGFLPSGDVNVGKLSFLPDNKNKQKASKTDKMGFLPENR